jgi:hypothetical protein
MGHKNPCAGRLAKFSTPAVGIPTHCMFWGLPPNMLTGPNSMRHLIVAGLMVAMLLFALRAERRDSEPDPGMLMIFLGVAFLSLFLVRILFISS